MDEFNKKILEYLGKKKLTKDQLKKDLNIKGEEEVNFFDMQLSLLEENGLIFLDKDNYYHLSKNLVYEFGKIKILENGTGIVEIDNKQYKISHENLLGALPEDIVMINPSKNPTVEKIIKRSSPYTLFKCVEKDLFKPYGINTNFYLKIKKNNLPKGTIVLAQISKTPYMEDDLLLYNGYIEKEIGHVDDPDIALRVIGLKYGFDNKFSPKIEKEVEKIPKQVTQEDLKDRKDLREEMFFTIDSSHTKDLDDAVSLTWDDNSYKLKVSIADVSHYLKDNKILFNEALRRGNSAYLADSVFPMLPHKLSNGICSLNPNEDRLTKTVEMNFDKQGNLVSSSIYNSVINSQKQMDYDFVNKVLKGKKIEDYEDYREILEKMNELSKLLEHQRIKKGSLEFASREIEVETSDTGEIIDLKLRKQDDAEKMIENFMIAANTEVTEQYSYYGYPFIYRIHEKPDNKRLEQTLIELKEQNILSSKLINKMLRVVQSEREIKPKTVQILLNCAKQSPYYEICSYLLLKSMKRAQYSKTNVGHFATALPNYSHFTSPIRRSADLFNHMVIEYINELNYCEDEELANHIVKQLHELENQLEYVCFNASEQERQADKAEKEAIELKQATFVKDNIEMFSSDILATIKYINRSGIYGTINNVIDFYINAEDLYKKGYFYKTGSKTYVNKNKDTLSIGRQIIISDPEVSLENRKVYFHDFQTIVKEKPKINIKK